MVGDVKIHRHQLLRDAHAWLSAAVRDDLSAGPNASLFFGAPTLAFVTHAAADRPGKLRRALANLDTSTAAVTRRRLDEAHARIDRRDRLATGAPLQPVVVGERDPCVQGLVLLSAPGLESLRCTRERGVRGVT